MTKVITIEGVDYTPKPAPKPSECDGCAFHKKLKECEQTPYCYDNTIGKYIIWEALPENNPENTFCLDGYTYQAEEDTNRFIGCTRCDLHELECHRLKNIPPCCASDRKDGRMVHFFRVDLVNKV